MTTEHMSALVAEEILNIFRQILGEGLMWKGRGLEAALAARSNLTLKQAEGWLGQFVRWGIIRRVSLESGREWRLAYPYARFSPEGDHIRVDYSPRAGG